MVSRFQTSFIPQRTITPESSQKFSQKSLANIQSVVVVVIFLITLAGAIGIFLYQEFLDRKIEAMKSQLDLARAAFEPTLIEEIKRLNIRLETAKEVLANHMALTPVFKILELNTLRSVRFENFRFTANNINNAQISMSGEATTFAAIALQSDVLGTSREVNDSVFSNLNPAQDRLVNFSFDGSISPRILKYENTLAGFTSQEEIPIEESFEEVDPLAPFISE